MREEKRILFFYHKLRISIQSGSSCFQQAGLCNGFETPGIQLENIEVIMKKSWFGLFVCLWNCRRDCCWLFGLLEEFLSVELDFLQCKVCLGEFFLSYFIRNWGRFFFGVMVSQNRKREVFVLGSEATIFS